MPDRENLSVEEITTDAALAALAGEWSRLWDECPAATPFQSPEWLVTWWRHFGGDGLWTLAVRDRGRLAGLAPFFVYAPKRQVTFVGNGITDYQDCLFAPGAAAIEAVFDHLARHSSRWDLCALEDVRDASLLWRALIPPGFERSAETGSPCPVLALPDTFDEFLAGVGPNLRRNLRRYRAHLEAVVNISFERASPESLPEYLDAFFRLHSARWRGRGGGVLAAGRVEAFHRDAAPRLFERGWLRLYGLRCGGEFAGIVYSLSSRQTVYLYLGGFDPAWSKFSPGSLLIAHVIGESIREEARELHFLRGAENYKYQWGAANRFNRRFILSHTALAGVSGTGAC